jgi:hypothetical protein
MRSLHKKYAYKRSFEISDDAKENEMIDKTSQRSRELFNSGYY